MNTVGHWIQLKLEANETQMVHIKIFNIIGEVKMSVWKTLDQGCNIIPINVSTLGKGNYRVTVSYLNEQLREERFTLY
ncbi:MAG: hypothetical protein U0U66_10985 [Cytophagaceae bacterium]